MMALAGVLDVLALAESAIIGRPGWKLDSGATQHITNTTAAFRNFISYGVPKILLVGKAGVKLAALGEGTIVLRLPSPVGAGQLGGATSDFTMTRVWYCPDCPFQLISTRRVVEAGHTIQLDSKGATILAPDGRLSVWLGMDVSGLYSCLPEAELEGIPAAMEGVAGLVFDVADNVLPQGMRNQLVC
jgi:hypothetical protein